MTYWLDSDVLVYAKDNIAPFGYAAFSGLWNLLEANISNGTVRITKRNYQEITEGRDSEDDLAKWIKLRKGEHVCVSPSKEVQAFAAKIADYVYNNDQFYARYRTRFSKGADAWLIAQAAVNGATVVTREVSAPTGHDPKIPDLCAHFGVKVTTLIELMKILGEPKPTSKPKSKIKTRRLAK